MAGVLGGKGQCQSCLPHKNRRADTDVHVFILLGFWGFLVVVVICLVGVFLKSNMVILFFHGKWYSKRNSIIWLASKLQAVV